MSPCIQCGGASAFPICVTCLADEPVITFKPLPPGFAFVGPITVTEGRGFFNERGEWEEGFVTYDPPLSTPGTGGKE